MNKFKSIIDKFKIAADEYPQYIAIQKNGLSCSYQKLEQLTSTVAQYFTDMGVGPNHIVASLLPRSIELPIIALAIMKAGGIYCPIDPNLPTQRIQLILGKTQPNLLIGDEKFQNDFIDYPIEFITTQELLVLDNKTFNQPLIKPHQIAYIIFTSGSTGNPKAVLLKHDGLINLINEQIQFFNLNNQSRVLQFASPSFDASISEIFISLCSGATLVIPDDGSVLSGDALSELILEQKITCITLPPTIATTLFGKKLTTIKTLVLAGEKPTQKHIQHFKDIEFLINAYGPTETTVCASLKRLTHDSIPSTIGSPISGMKIFIADEELKIVKKNDIGEIIISGIGLANGYLNDPQLTAKYFFDIKEDNSSLPRGRYYRTGDYGQFLENGDINYIGRNDDQIKWHGYRIEPKEIEDTLLKIHHIQQCLVTHIRTNESDQIVAFIQSAHNLNSSLIRDIQNQLKKTLPVYMIPHAMKNVCKFPLTINGKIDKLMLIEQFVYNEQKDFDNLKEELIPRTTWEENILDIWKQLFYRDDINITNNFYALGGHSLLEASFVFLLQEKYDIHIPLQFIADNPTVKEIADVIEKKYSNRDTIKKDPVIPDPENLYNCFPLTDVQQAYLLGRKSEFLFGNISVHAYYEFEFKHLDITKFNDAFNKLIQRHDALRIVFTQEGQQQILPNNLNYTFETYLEKDGEISFDTKKHELRNKFSHQIFNPEKWPLFSIAVVYNKSCYCLHFSFDALIIDGLSLQILLYEWEILYNDLNIELEPLSISFRDYVIHYNGFLKSKYMEIHKQYWMNRLNSLPSSPQLPINSGYTKIKSPEFVRTTKQISAKLWQLIKNKISLSQISPTVFVITVFAYTLAKWSREQRFTLNLTIFNRLPIHHQINQLIGDFSSILLLGLDFRNYNECSFNQYLEKVQRQLREDLTHRHYSGIEVLRSLRRLENQETDVMMPIVLTSFLNDEITSHHLRTKLFSNSTYGITQTSQVFLDFKVFENEGNLVLEWDYLKDIFPENMVIEMHDVCNQLIISLAENTEVWDKALSVPLTSQQQSIQSSINNTSVPIINKRLEDLFVESAISRPDQIAVIYEKQQLTYQYIYNHAMIVSNAIYQKTNGKNVNIGIFIQKGWEQIVACLGILLCNATYIPIDPQLPAAVIDELGLSATLSFILTTAVDVEKLKDLSFCKELLKQNTFIISSENIHNYLPKAINLNKRSSELAYIIFTSGSTGKPKGVMIKHEAAVNTIASINKLIALKPEDRIFALSQLNFDLSVYDIFGAFAAGATICLPSSEDYKEPEKWIDYLREHQVSVWNSVPMFMQMLIARLEIIQEKHPLKHLRTILLSGDKIPSNLPSKIYNNLPNTKLYSLGGATEASIWSIYYPIPKNHPSHEIIPYGTPLSNQQFYVLNGALDDCPPWVIGQLYIAGKGLAAGYYNDSHKTRDAFIFHRKLKIPLYNTGDLGYRLPNGVIQFVGRNDGQIKLSGYRVELGEIEAKAITSGLIKEAVAIIDKTNPTQALYLFVVKNAKFNTQDQLDLQNYLSRNLPHYMQPNGVLLIDSIPLTSNGKVNHKQLLSLIKRELCQTKKSKITRDGLYNDLGLLWRDILQIDKNIQNDNFFKQGGDSLSATRLISAINKKYQLDLALRLLFDNPRFDDFYEKINSFIKSNFKNKFKTLQKTNNNINKLSHGQMRMYFINQLLEDPSLYHLQNIFKLVGPIDKTILQRALDFIISKHDILRTQIVEDTSHGLCQIVHDDVSLEISEIHVEENNILSIANNDYRLPFDFSQAPLLRIKYIITEVNHYLIFTMHHVIVDAWSLSILYKDISYAYTQFINQRPIKMELNPIQYKDYSNWQHNFINDNKGTEQINYWINNLKDHPQCINLPKDRPYPEKPSFSGDTVARNVSSGTKIKIANFCQLYNLTPYMLFFGVFILTLNKYTGDTDIIIGTPIANRNNKSWETILGFFVNTLPIRIKINHKCSINNFFEYLRTEIISAYDNQDVPLDIIIDHVNTVRDNRYNPLFQIMFDYQIINSMATYLNLDNCHIQEIKSEKKTAQFDLTLDVQRSETELKLIFNFNTDIFDVVTLNLFAEGYLFILEQALENQGQSTADLRLLRMQQTEYYSNILQGPNLSKAEPYYFIEKLFSQNHNNNAIIDEDRIYSYSDLYSISDHISEILESITSKENTMFAVVMEKSFVIIAILLAIWKGRHCYVPIDISQPDKRTQSIISNLDISYIFIEESMLKNYANKYLSSKKIDINNHVFYLLQRESISISNKKQQAYILHTSGTTGLPKAVSMSFLALSNKLNSWLNVYNLPQNSVHLQLAQMTFDVFIGDVLRSLSTSGCLLLVKKSIALDMPKLYQIITKYNVSFAEFVPQLLKQLCMYIKKNNYEKLSLQSLIIGSDKLFINDLTLIKSQCSAKVKLYNSYGTTETCIDNTLYEIKDNVFYNLDNETVSIGTPLPGERMLVVDSDNSLVPPGVIGELIIEVSGTDQYYHTGDLVKYNESGLILYTGRKDDIFKLRGYRIDPAEIIQIIKAFNSSIKDAILTIVTNPANQPTLVAYILMDYIDTEIFSILNNFVQSHLPTYMQPQQFIPIQEIPLNTNGKVDISKLPKVIWQDSEVLSRELNSIETRLAQIWSKVLNVDVNNPNCNFFTLGGDSISSIRIVSIAREKGLLFDVKTLFENPTIRMLALKINLNAMLDLTPLLDEHLDGIVALSPMQVDFFSNNKSNYNHFNQSIRLDLHSTINFKNFCQAIQDLVNQYDNFRLRFRYDKNQNLWLQNYAPFNYFDNHTKSFDFRHINNTLSKTLLPIICIQSTNKLSNSEIAAGQKHLNIEQGPLALVLLTTVDEVIYDCCFIAHHLIIDMLSWNAIIDDFNIFYLNTIQEENKNNSSKSISFKRCTDILQQLSINLEKGVISYWEKLSKLPNTIIPFDHTDVKYGYHTIEIEINQLPSEKLKKVLMYYRCSFEEFLITISVLTLRRLLGNQIIKFFIEKHGRDLPEFKTDILKVAGWFTSLFPVCFDFKEHELICNEKIIKIIKENIRNIPNNGNSFNLARFYNKSFTIEPIYPIVFNYFGAISTDLVSSSFFSISKSKLPSQYPDNYICNEYLSMNFELIDNRLFGYFIFSKQHYHESTINALIETFRLTATDLITHISEDSSNAVTSSDFPLVDLAEEDLNAIFN